MVVLTLVSALNIHDCSGLVVVSSISNWYVCSARFFFLYFPPDIIYIRVYVVSVLDEFGGAVFDCHDFRPTAHAVDCRKQSGL